jgi:hypothetical protein
MKRVQENPCLTARRKQDTTAKLEERNLGRQRRCKDHKAHRQRAWPHLLR